MNHERKIQIHRLENYMAQNAIKRISLLKIDTQGYEPEVLEGLGDRLVDVGCLTTASTQGDITDTCDRD